jgi:hypothetical protein
MNPNTEKQLEFIEAEWDAKRMVWEAELALLRAGVSLPPRPQEGPIPPTIPQTHVFPGSPTPLNP